MRFYKLTQSLWCKSCGQITYDNYINNNTNYNIIECVFTLGNVGGTQLKEVGV